MDIVIKSNYPFVIDEDINIFDCLSFFDAGYETVYIVNGRYEFNGLIIRKDDFKNVWKGDGNSWISKLNPSKCIVDPDDDADLQKQLIQIITDNSIGEIPVLLHNKIISIARTEKIEKAKVNWDLLEEIECRKRLKNMGPICISSLADENLRSFYNKFRHCLDIILLNEKSLDNYLNNEYSLFIYASEVFLPKEKIVQMNYIDLYQTLLNRAFERIKSRIQIVGSWAALHENQCNPVEYIKCFDQGFDSISVIDDDDHFKALLCKHNYLEDFPGKNYRRWSNLFVEEGETPEKTIEDLTAMFFGTERQEIPVLREKKIVALGKYSNFLWRQDHTEALKLKIYWKYIDYDLVYKYFTNKKILISSAFEDIGEFYDLYKSSLDITILDDNSLMDYLSGVYDILIYGSDIWPNINRTIKINALNLYKRLLTETAVKFLSSHSVRYYEIQRISSLNSQERWSGEPYHLYCGNSGVVWKKNYYVFPDEKNLDGCNIINGSRITASQPTSWKNSLYFFGTCLAAGLFAAKDSDTIESKLQEKLNQYYPDTYRVINMGSIGGSAKSYINVIYRILDSNFKPGDIVINYTDMPNEDFFPLSDYVYDFSIPFKKNPDTNCFIEGIAPHLDKEGNKIFAEYIFDILFPSLQITEQKNESKNFRFLDFFKLENEIPDVLAAYLKDLKRHQFKKTKGKKIGSIVMNCNPFTKGHQYLIEKSLEQADYLYIFVVEEDKSYFKFNDRFNMVKLFCDKYPRIKVLPSGQYIISSITFAEYFNKDSLQDISIDPTFDATIFAEHIAPALNIKYRFVGEEPFDKVTAQYNLALKDVLPNYSIDLIEIPRCAVNDEIISASLVRRFMKEKNFEKLQQYLPDTTFSYLTEHNYF